MRFSSRWTAATAIAVTLLLASCGGSSKSTDAATDAPTTDVAAATEAAPADGTTAVASDAAASDSLALPAMKGPTMVDTKASMKVVNVAIVGGKPMDIDVWMGTPGYGEKVATVPAGQVSDDITLKVTEGKDVTAGFDGQITLMPKDDADPSHIMQSSAETWLDGEKRILIAGSSDATPLPGTVQFGISQSWIYLSGGKSEGVAAPPAGKASVFGVSTGLAHLRPNDFVVPGIVGKCFEMDSANSLATGNLGSAYFIDPGTYDLALFDANTGCATALGTPATTTVAAGDRYVLVATGLTKDSRSALLLKI